MKENFILTIENLSFSYPDKSDVLKEVCFRISSGEHVGLVGPNGSGKTTLFLLLCGILAPQSGRITATGKRVAAGRFNPNIAYLFQSPEDQLFSTTLFDDVTFGPLNMALPREEVELRAARSLEQVGCSSLSERAPHHLSGGEKRLAAFATVLSMMPDIILLDEPTSNLDSLNRRNVINIIRQMKQTLMICSHDLEFLLETCQRVILIDRGRIVREGAIVELLSDERLMKSHHLEKPHSLTPHNRLSHDHR